MKGSEIYFAHIFVWCIPQLLKCSWYPSELCIHLQTHHFGLELNTLPRPSERSEKKCDIPFMIQSHAESMKKILGAI